MTITETRFQHRPTTDVPFFNSSLNLPVLTAWISSLQPYLTAGTVTKNVTVSSDGLDQTSVFTYDSLETFSAVDTLRSIEESNEYVNYTRTNGLIELDSTQLDNRRQTYQLTGIDQPFTVTTTYTFPPVNPEQYSPTQIVAVFSNALETFATGLDKKKNIILDEDVVTIIHQYDNASDFTDNCYNDLFFVPQLATAGATRTIEYALV
jgi:hypothetical protein